MKTSIATWIGVFFFWSFVCVKVGGSSLAAWSWLWIFLPIVPIGSLIVQKLGL